MFSIVIPLYNKEKCIASTLSSVLNQSFKDFEVIIVNDGSNDNSIDVVNSFDDDRIVLINKFNTGVSDSRNVGVQIAKYEWIAFLDADDIKHPDFLKEIRLQITKYQDKSIFSTGYSISNFQSKDRYINKYLPHDGDVEVIDYIECISVGEPPINSSNSVICKSVLLESGGFIKGQRNYEDHELWLRIYKENDIVFINKDLLTIRRDLDGTARQNVISQIDLTRFLNTILKVDRRLSRKKQTQFKYYYYKYCLYIFKKAVLKYEKEEQSIIIKQMQQLLDGVTILGLKFLSKFFTQKTTKTL